MRSTSLTISMICLRHWRRKDEALGPSRSRHNVLDMCNSGMHRSFVVKCKPSRWLFSDYKYQAKKRGHSWRLTYEQFKVLIRDHCHYCGKKPGIRSTSRGKVRAHGVDRKSNKRGYTVKNSLPCCSTCNIMKWKLGYREFLDHVRRIRWHVVLREIQLDIGPAFGTTRGRGSKTTKRPRKTGRRRKASGRN